MSEIQENRRLLENVVNEEWVLTEKINEEYDEWYSEDTEEFLYEDENNIGRTIEEGCRLVHTCVDAELYQEGYGLAEFLLTLMVVAEGEFGSSQLSIRELEEEQIITLDYEKFVLEALMAAYCGHPLQQRPDALYGIFLNAGCEEVSLEKLMQQNKYELDQFAEFLKLWIEYLGKRKGKMENRLLEEAVNLVDDTEVLLPCCFCIFMRKRRWLWDVRRCAENMCLPLHLK